MVCTGECICQIWPQQYFWSPMFCQNLTPPHHQEESLLHLHANLDRLLFGRLNEQNMAEKLTCDLWGYVQKSDMASAWFFTSWEKVHTSPHGPVGRNGGQPSWTFGWTSLWMPSSLLAEALDTLEQRQAVAAQAPGSGCEHTEQCVTPSLGVLFLGFLFCSTDLSLCLCQYHIVLITLAL